MPPVLPVSNNTVVYTNSNGRSIYTKGPIKCRSIVSITCCNKGLRHIRHLRGGISGRPLPHLHTPYTLYGYGEGIKMGQLDTLRIAVVQL